jgi:alpha-L-arabinofuranosidase
VSYKRLSKHFESVTGRKNIPIAITEYNSVFPVNKPLPFRHSLGAALLNAGSLMVMMRPENNVLMANYHQFVNSFFGSIKNDDFMQGSGEYIKRPNYYTLEMFSRHFGDELIDVRIKDNNMDDKPVLSKATDLLLKIPWKRKIVFGADIDVLDDGTIKVGFNGNKDINFHHVHKKVSVEPDTTYLLSGYLKAENLKTGEGVGIMIVDSRGWQLLNNETTEKVWGTTGWIPVELEYTTLSDTSNINVLIRRISGRGGPISGDLYVRDVKLTKKRSPNEQNKDELMISASKDKATDNLYLLVLNKSLSDDIGASIKFNNKELRKKATVRTLNGPDIWSLNETDPGTVMIKKESINMNNDNQIKYVFPAHSLTSIELDTVN